MSEYTIEQPLSREILALYHTDALSSSEKEQVEAFLTEQDRAYLHQLDSMHSALADYAAHDFLPSDETEAHILQKLQEEIPSLMADPLQEHTNNVAKNHKTLFRTLASLAAAIIIALCVLSFTHLFHIKHHLAAHLSQTTIKNSTIFSTRASDHPIKIKPLSLQSQALACVNNLKHSHYTFKDIISLSTKNSQHLTHILLRQAQGTHALLFTVPYACLLDPHKNYSFQEKLVNY